MWCSPEFSSTPFHSVSLVISFISMVSIKIYTWISPRGCSHVSLTKLQTCVSSHPKDIHNDNNNDNDNNHSYLLWISVRQLSDYYFIPPSLLRKNCEVNTVIFYFQERKLGLDALSDFSKVIQSIAVLFLISSL
jgi:hypothetical protein